MARKDASIGTLQPLAASRGYRAVSRGGEYWLVNLRSRLPEANQARRSLVFSRQEAEAFLRRLTQLEGEGNGGSPNRGDQKSV
jgi:hypothetical protein